MIIIDLVNYDDEKQGEKPKEVEFTLDEEDKKEIQRKNQLQKQVITIDGKIVPI